jgi:DNA (cytosine-5)-methyltransferase 1
MTAAPFINRGAPRAYYNEFDPFAAEWLRNLIKAGEIADGDVDERSILDVLPVELAGYTQCHFFAGIGGWSRALRIGGWPDDRPIWTGSCPCQPFSAAGSGGGFDDERHLWPAFFHLIDNCRPVEVRGEQVASKDGLGWLDIVSADLEGAGYAVETEDRCAAGFGAPHIRQRLYFRAVADTDHTRPQGRNIERSGRASECAARESGVAGGMADTDSRERDGRAEAATGNDSGGADTGRAEGDGSLAARGEHERPGPTNGFWRLADWILCNDPDGPRFRPVEPGTFPLAHGVAGRVGQLRAYGNAIVAPQAIEFCKVVKEVLGI